MAPHFPDEIISEILTPALCVPDKQFADTSTDKSVFATCTESTSSILLVCKAWLRVATPLLYNVVVLRSTAQAKALHLTLKKHPELGSFIRKLRVEGGFGSSMHGILQRAPKITDIFISLNLHGSESPSGLVSGLPLINPRRLIIGDNPDRTLQNKQVRQVVATLESLAEQWSNLTTLVVPYRFGQRSGFVQRMASAPSVTTVSFPTDQNRIPYNIGIVASMPSIHVVELRSAISSDAAAKMLSDSGYSNYRHKLRIVDPRWDVPSATVALPVNTAFEPLAFASQAIVDCPLRSNRPADMLLSGKARSPNHRRLQYLLVSKTFYRVGLPFLYRWPDLNSGNTLPLCRKISAEPALGLHLRQMTSQSHSRSIASDMPSLFSHAPHLTHVGTDHAVNMDWRVFKTLAQTAGASLVELYVHVTKGTTRIPDALVFCDLIALRKLTWNCPNLSFPPPQNVSGGLPSLVSFELEDPRGEGFIAALTSMDLLKIRHVILPSKSSTKEETEYYALLQKHGNKIQQLDMHRPHFAQTLALCPNLRSLNIGLGASSLESYETYTQTLDCPQKHESLEKIGLDKSAQVAKANEDREWNVVFDGLFNGLIAKLKFTNLPALREIQSPQCMWPEPNPRAISQSGWVKHAERMLGYGIKITDAQGHCWQSIASHSTTTPPFDELVRLSSPSSPLRTLLLATKRIKTELLDTPVSRAMLVLCSRDLAPP
ncbi:hypothetical protein FB45DRAFT_1082308 [Roridomyces roridus]|uniref:Uncharacterized protein n=1 Tax=Roridomyces roridus TaxID=1738132 RepID=A0AAD7FLN8_9AGAR|nr:hypothetical protein FB45DRAFT_1082308 [Roridomyces roridus]